VQESLDTLTEKEKQTLRLIVRGHDAKSLARQLNLSVHTVNERLRDARRKIGVSSSREAARLLFERENATPEKSADTLFGEAAQLVAMRQGGTFNAKAKPRLILLLGGLLMLLSIVLLSSISAFNEAPPSSATAARDQAGAVATAPASDATQSALDWLALVDRHQWQDSWKATGSAFQKLNTVEVWTSASLEARVPLGAVADRTAVGEESVPAPPHGYQIVKFRTSFENKPDTIETLSLVDEGGQWRVVGYLIG